PERVARVEQSFRGDTADRDADPADAVPLDQRDLRALRLRVERRDVSPGATAEDRDVVALLAHLVEQPSRARRVSFERMSAITASQQEPEVQREERETDAVVLLDVPSFMRPERGARLARADDDMAERDRGVAAHRDEDVREAPIGHIQEAAVTDAGPDERQQAHKVSERIGVVSRERAQQ